MKKILTVMLIAVMAAGFVFAGVSGTVKSNFTFGKTDPWGYNADVKAKFTWEETAKVGGEGVHAEVTAKATLTTTKGDDFKLDPSVSAKIVAGDVVVKLSDSYGVDYAKSWVIGDDDKPVTWKTSVASEGKGIEVDYKGARLGLGNLSVYAETPELEVAGVKAQAAAIWAKGDASVSAKASYTSDVVALAVACDADLPTATQQQTTGFDVAGTVKVAFLTVDAYYADEKTLDVKAVADLASFEVPAKLTASVTGFCRAAVENKYVLAADYKDEVVAGVTVSFVPGKTVEWGVSCEVPVDVFTIGASFGEKFDVEHQPAHALEIKPTVYVGTDKLVEGAKLALTWRDANLADHKLGCVEASCEIKF